MMKTQKTIELQGKTHRKRHFKIKTPKTHSNIENKPRLIHSPIAKEIASMKARNPPAVGCARTSQQVKHETPLYFQFSNPVRRACEEPK